MRDACGPQVLSYVHCSTPCLPTMPRSPITQHSTGFRVSKRVAQLAALEALAAVALDMPPPRGGPGVLLVSAQSNRVLLCC